VLLMSVPFLPAEPRAPANRRMSLIVMNREAEERALRGGALPAAPSAPEPSAEPGLPAMDAAPGRSSPPNPNR